MAVKLKPEELAFLMRLASPQRPLQLLYRGPDDVFLLGERESWAQQWVTYIRLRQATERDEQPKTVARII